MLWSLPLHSTLLKKLKNKKKSPSRNNNYTFIFAGSYLNTQAFFCLFSSSIIFCALKQEKILLEEMKIVLTKLFIQKVKKKGIPY